MKHCPVTVQCLQCRAWHPEASGHTCIKPLLTQAMEETERLKASGWTQQEFTTALHELLNQPLTHKTDF